MIDIDVGSLGEWVGHAVRSGLVRRYRDRDRHMPRDARLRPSWWVYL